jgi:prophage regulatory protein
MKRFVRLPEVLASIGIAERTLYALMHRGEFPRPAKIGKMSVWVADEIEQWQIDRMAEREAKPSSQR